ncbi:MAG: hypothetical protein ACO23V_07115 [Chitinophagaceae bacterium]
MNTLEWVGLLTIGIASVIYLAFWVYDKRKISMYIKQNKSASETNSLQLQAYERLVILSDRIALPNLLYRIPSENLSAQQYQKLLTETIRQEFDYNISQQLYVTIPVWEAITNLKEQNIYIIHQVAQTLPLHSKGSELSKRILELLQTDPNVSLHNVVVDAIRFEAKKLMI